MNTSTILEKLAKEHPGKPVICIPRDAPTEILCEVEPTSLHPEYSAAIAVIERSAPHVHHKTKETYKVLEGELIVHKDKEELHLMQGDSLSINPGEVHWAEGDDVWIECYSQPGWTSDDHILI